MPRAIWKAFITFGRVSVPMELCTAVKDVRPHSHLLHDADPQRLQQGTLEVAAPVGGQQAVEQEEGQDRVAALEESLARTRARS